MRHTFCSWVQAKMLDFSLLARLSISRRRNKVD